MGNWLEGRDFIRWMADWQKKLLNPERRVNLFYTGSFIRKVPLARSEFWSNKNIIFVPSRLFKGSKIPLLFGFFHEILTNLP